MVAPFDPANPRPGKLGAADAVQRWGAFTLQGNLAFERGEEFKARQSYSEALAVAEELMLAAAQRHDTRAALYAPALFGIACNNIIDLARRQGDGLTAGIFQCKLAAGFLSVMESNEAPVSLRSRCLLHSRLASSALCSYFEERGMWDAAETYTTRANAAFFAVQRLASSVVPRAEVAIRQAAAESSQAPLDDEVVLVLPDEVAAPDELALGDSLLAHDSGHDAPLLGEAVIESAVDRALMGDAFAAVSLAEGGDDAPAIDGLLDSALSFAADELPASHRLAEGPLLASPFNDDVLVDDTAVSRADPPPLSAAATSLRPAPLEAAFPAEMSPGPMFSGAMFSEQKSAGMVSPMPVLSLGAAPADARALAHDLPLLNDALLAQRADLAFDSARAPALPPEPVMLREPPPDELLTHAGLLTHEALLSHEIMRSSTIAPSDDTELSQDALITPRPLISNDALLRAPMLYSEEPPRPSMPSPAPLEPPKTARARLMQWLGRAFFRRPGRTTMTSLGDIVRAK